ncbi:MAG: HAMP domain-containing protein [Actinobacteria bacterium]|nr:HAMP domain-containing protein [Actinomycetota bacterium]
MLARISSFRIQLLAATAITGVLGLFGANAAVTILQNRDSRANDQRKARIVAQQLAARLANGAPLARVREAQSVLPDDQIEVRRRGGVVYAGPPLAHTEIEGVESATFPGGTVVVRRHSSKINDAAAPVVVTLIFGVVLALVIASAALVSSLLARRVRRPLSRAISVADRVAAGDFSARLGTLGLAEFEHFGAAFDAMADRLERSDRDQRQFLADVAHELATPLNGLVGFATALADGTADTAEDRAEAAQMIERESGRIVALLHDLRELTRVDLFESVHPEAVRLDRFAQEMLARASPLLAGAELTVATSLSRVEVMADPRILESIVRNLLSNAVQYTAAGGEIRVWTAARNGEAVLGVRDTGIGIAPEHAARVFDRLYRVDEARPRASGGSGLGLSIATRAASALGGRIELESELGSGTEFRLALPALGSSRRSRRQAQ